MRVALANPQLLDELRARLERSGFLALRESEATLLVQPLNSVSARYDRDEIRAFLQVWQELHPEAKATLLG